MKKILLLLLPLMILACKEENKAGFAFSASHDELSLDEARSSGSLIAAQSTSKAAISPPAAPPEETNSPKDSKIIKSGNLEFSVDKIEEGKRRMDAVLKRFHGYYEKEELNSYARRKTYSLQIRVPNAKFDSLVVNMENGVGELVSKSLSANDVTEEYTDLGIRLESKLAYLAQYKEILKRAKTIEEILEVQGKIRWIEEEIESKKGRLQYLDSRVNYATLNVQIYQEFEVIASTGPGIGSRMLFAFRNGGAMFINFVIGLIHVWPFVIIIGLVFIGRKRIFGIFKRNKGELT